MKPKLQFQNLVLKQALSDSASPPKLIQPVITLPVRPGLADPAALTTLHPAYTPTATFVRPSIPDPPTAFNAGPALTHDSWLNDQRPLDYQAAPLVDFPFAEDRPDVPLDSLPSEDESHAPLSRKKRTLRGVALALSALLVVLIVITWHASSTSNGAPTVVQSNSASSAAALAADAPSPTAATGFIQIYVLGAVAHPGVYSLPANSRVYQLLQAAGGPLPAANMVSLNLAARLTDGEEIYVSIVGETPPAYSSSASTGSDATPTGPLVNINTADQAEMEQNLQVSSTTAQKIIAYRTAHGLYTSVEELLQAISQSIYDRIKDMVTI